MIEQREPHCKPGVNSCAPEGWSVRAPLVEPVVLVLLQLRWYVRDGGMNQIVITANGIYQVLTYVNT